MTKKNLPARPLFHVWLSLALSFASVACSDDDDGGNTGPSTPDATVGTPDAAVAIPDSSANVSDAGGGACLDNVYAELSDGCGVCSCNVDPQLAPSCKKPCWDFIACSFAAQTGKCAAAAAGGAATRAEFEACTMEECGAQLAVPGAEVVSSYRSIIGACAVSMGNTNAACGDDIVKFQSALKK
jgi:hypothetical protein